LGFAFKIGELEHSFDAIKVDFEEEEASESWIRCDYELRLHVDEIIASLDEKEKREPNFTGVCFLDVSNRDEEQESCSNGSLNVEREINDD
jgi:hypothetical protein